MTILKTRHYLLTNVFFFIFLNFSWSQITVTSTAGQATGNYTTLSESITKINDGTHQGEILIEVVGNTTEPRSVQQILKSGGSSSYNSITIIPVGGPWTITSDSLPFNERGLLEIRGGDNITIDGDPLNTGTKNLIFDQLNTGSEKTGVIRVCSASSSDGASNITIKNCILKGSRSSETSIATSYGIVHSRYSDMDQNAYSDSHFIYQNNEIYRVHTGIYVTGRVSYYAKYLQILDNIIGSDQDDLAVGSTGIYITGTGTVADDSSPIIEGNDIRAGSTTETADGPGNDVFGIRAAYSVEGTVIRFNKIHHLFLSSSGFHTIRGIWLLGSSLDLEYVEISNNIIGPISAKRSSIDISSPGYTVRGISTGSPKYLKINNNSIYLPEHPEKIGADNVTFGITTGGKSLGSELCNNIVVNENISANSFCIDTWNAGTGSGSLQQNNIYFAPNCPVGRYSGTFGQTISAYQSLTGKEANSLEADPNFISFDDLHIDNTSASILESAGLTLATNIDVDGNIRPNSAASANGGGVLFDIGADEFDGIPLDSFPPVITELATVNCAGSPMIFQFEIKDLSGVPQSGVGLPVLFWKNSSDITYTQVTGVHVEGDTYNFDLATDWMSNSDIDYYVVAQDLAATPKATTYPIYGVDNITVDPPSSDAPSIPLSKQDAVAGTQVESSEDNGALTSLRTIILCAAAGSTITFASGLDTVELDAPLLLDKELIIQGDIIDPNLIQLDFTKEGFDGTAYGLQNSAGNELTLSNLIIENLGLVLPEVGMINEGELDADNVRLIGNIPAILTNQGAQAILRVSSNFDIEIDE